MDVTSKNFDASLFVRFQQGSPGETYEHGIGKNFLHGFVQFTGLCAMTFIHIDINIPFGTEVTGKVSGDVFNEPFIVGFLFVAEFVYQRTHQPRQREIKFFN